MKRSKLVFSWTPNQMDEYMIDYMNSILTDINTHTGFKATLTHLQQEL